MLKIFFVIILILSDNVHADTGYNSAFDHNLYEEVLNPQECENQLAYITNEDSFLKAQFMDAGIRIPRGILIGNYRDMGNYHQCLQINEELQGMSVHGKYCVIEVPFYHNFEKASSEVISPEFPWDYSNWEMLMTINAQTKLIQQYDLIEEHFKNHLGKSKCKSRKERDIPLADVNLELAICIPKVCSVEQALNRLTSNASLVATISEAFCRLPNDKPWVAADYVAIAIFSAIALMTVLSTFYDLRHSVILKKDPKEANKLYTIFSMYTNTRKLLTFRSDPNALNCMDGVRSIAMLWVVVIHTFGTTSSLVPANPIDVNEHMRSFGYLWITSGHITVDTFFMLTGLLLVYTQASKMSRMAFLKNLHIFYLNRLLRMFPVLATGILLQASFQNHISDGPYWGVVAKSTDDCRNYWWATLLYVHNLTKFGYLCLGHTWYLAVDMQLYVLSPIVLIWVLGGNKKSAWMALIGSLLAVLAGTSVYNFLMEFQSSMQAMSRTPEDVAYYSQYYYIHTFPRSAPFFVGMLFGYVLHTCRNQKIRLSKVLVAFLWLLATITALTIVISTYFVIQPDWDNQTVDSILNSYMRPAWAACIAWLIFACVHGYGGPMNWFLSLNVFRFLSRLSYAMYILHLPMIYILNATALAPTYFSIEFSMHRFIIDLNLTIFVSFLVTVFIDLPFSGLFGMLLNVLKGGRKTEPKKSNNYVNHRLRKISAALKKTDRAWKREVIIIRTRSMKKRDKGSSDNVPTFFTVRAPSDPPCK